MTSPRCPWSRLAYRLLLRFYPIEYRQRFGSGMDDTFMCELTHARQAGPVALAQFWLVTVGHGIWFGLRHRGSRGIHMAIDPRAWRWFPGALVTDVSYAFRVLRRTPIVTVTSIVSLAVGIAGVMTVFIFGRSLLLQDIPGVREPSRIVLVARTTNGAGWGPLSPWAVEQLAARTNQLQSLAALADSAPFSLNDGAKTDRVWGWLVSTNFFDVVGAAPEHGRLFRQDDGISGRRPVVVLSHRFWKRHFHGDHGIIGNTVRVNGVACVVVGVAAKSFDSLSFVGGDLWMPTTAAPLLSGEGNNSVTNPASFWLRAVGRLAPGSNLDSTRAELNTLMAGLKRDEPSIPKSFGVAVEPLGRTPVPVRPAFTAFVAVLFALTGAVLAIVCSNVAGVFMARAAARQREMATRLAIGASRGRVVGQMIVETLVLFSIAGIAALPLAIALLNRVAVLASTRPLPVSLDLSLTGESLALAGGLTLASGLLFGLLPARQASRADLASMLYGQSSTASRNRLRLRHLLVAGQIAVSLTLVITTGLFVRTLHAASTSPLGFESTNVDVVTLDTRLAGSAVADPQQLLDRIVERIAIIDGVQAVGHGFRIPLIGGTYAVGEIRLPNDRTGTGALVRHANWDIVSPDYFRAIGVDVRQGRPFRASDRGGAPDVAVVNETFARLAWPGQSALGQRFSQGVQRTYEVIGIVADSVYQSIAEPPRPVVYIPFSQRPQPHVELFVRHQPGLSRAAEIRRAVADVAPDLPIVAMRTFDDAVAWALFPRRAAGSVAASGAVLGLLLSAVGLYGLVTFVVAQRSREFAIRMALGASPQQVKRLVLHQTLGLGLAGTVAGFALAAGLGQVIRAQGLFINVSPLDPTTFIVSALIIACVVFGGTLLPACRAASLDPVRNLRAD